MQPSPDDNDIYQANQRTNSLSRKQPPEGQGGAQSRSLSSGPAKGASTGQAFNQMAQNSSAQLQ